MSEFKFEQKTYEIDSGGFLVDVNSWDKGFAVGMAETMNMPQGLTTEHWDVIQFIRATYDRSGRCPTVYETCRMRGLRRRELKLLFPDGYLRGACKLAGITYREGYLGQTHMPLTADDLNLITANKSYAVDVRGFLVDPSEWDEYYAAYRAYDMKIPGGKLTEDHWQVIRFLRDSFMKTGNIPTVYDTCHANQITLDELETLFPDGYHRGAVKIAGLRIR
jgi:TusE/DsrC/DsvC family sulfur relay protein